MLYYRGSVDAWNGKGYDVFLSKRSSPENMIRVVEGVFDGGTDFYTPLNEALRLMQEDGFENANVVFITDGEYELSKTYIEEL